MSDQPLAGKCLLIVEDEFFLADDLAQWMRDEGANVSGPVGNASQAMKLVSDGHVDAAIVDINLGLGPSFDVAQALEERQVPFLFATGYDQSVLAPRFANVPRVEKPFSRPRLVSAMQALLQVEKA